MHTYIHMHHIYIILLSKMVKKNLKDITLEYEWTSWKHLKIHMPYHNNCLLLHMGFLTRTAEERKPSVLFPLGSFYQIGLAPAVFAAAEWQFLKQFAQLRKRRAWLWHWRARECWKHLNAHNNNRICLYSLLLYKKHC